MKMYVGILRNEFLWRFWFKQGTLEKTNFLHSYLIRYIVACSLFLASSFTFVPRWRYTFRSLEVVTRKQIYFLRNLSKHPLRVRLLWNSPCLCPKSSGRFMKLWEGRPTLKNNMLHLIPRGFNSLDKGFPEVPLQLVSLNCIFVVIFWLLLRIEFLTFRSLTSSLRLLI